MTWLKGTKYSLVGKDENSFKSCQKLNSWSVELSLLSASREAHNWVCTMAFFSLQEKFWPQFSSVHIRELNCKHLLSNIQVYSSRHSQQRNLLEIPHKQNWKYSSPTSQSHQFRKKKKFKLIYPFYFTATLPWL